MVEICASKYDHVPLPLFSVAGSPKRTISSRGAVCKTLRSIKNTYTLHKKDTYTFVYFCLFRVKKLHSTGVKKFFSKLFLRKTVVSVGFMYFYTSKTLYLWAFSHHQGLVVVHCSKSVGTVGFLRFPTVFLKNLTRKTVGFIISYSF